MRPDLPWNVAGIPPEAREAARAAARREGLSMGEWLTRRILAGLSDDPPPRDSWNRRADSPYRSDYASDIRSEERYASQREADAMLDRVSRTETATSEVNRRIEEQLRTLGRRLDASERSLSENNREMSKAATEMNISAREHSQAFDQLGAHVVGLAERLDRIEHRDNGDGLRDAVKALHQGMSRLADQFTQSANQSASQVSSLAANLENVAGRIAQVRQDTQNAVLALQQNIAELEDRFQAVEKAGQSAAVNVERTIAGIESRQTEAAREASQVMARLQETVQRLATRDADPALERRLMGIERALLEPRAADPAVDRRIAGIERTLSDVVSRLDGNDGADRLRDSLRKIEQRLDALDDAHREVMQSLREKPLAPKSEEVPSAAAPSFPAQQQAFEPPPFAASQPPFAAGPPPFAAASPNFGSTYAPGDSFAPPSFDGTPQAENFAPQSVDSYLAAARRSARAAAQAESGRASDTYGAFGWGGTPRKSASSGRTRPLVVAIVAVIVIAIIAAVVLNNRPPIAPHPPIADQLDRPLPAPTEKAQSAAPAPDVDSSADSVPQDTPPGSPRVATPVKPAPFQRTAPPPARAAVAAPPPMTDLDKLTVLANAGNPKAELVVGLRYLDGTDVPVNDKEALKWLQRAADAGEPVAQYRLAMLYERGRGVPADAAAAARWYLAAANQGNRKAMHNLAVAYAEGSGVKKDFAESSRWFSRAANLGLSDSQFNLAVLYERGLGVPQSLLDAYKWYAIAAAQGDQESKARLGAIASQLNADDREAAQRAADNFKPGTMSAQANVPPTILEVVRTAKSG